MTKSQSQNRETNATTETHDKEPITKQRDKRKNGNTWQARTTRDRNVRISYTKRKHMTRRTEHMTRDKKHETGNNKSGSVRTYT